MQISHLPSLDARYWMVVALITILGSNAGDFVSDRFDTATVLDVHVPVVAALLLAVLWFEPRDTSASHRCYWVALLLVPMTSNDLAGLVMSGAPVGRIVIISCLLLALVSTFLIARSDAMHAVASNMMLRPKPNLPLTDASYWLGMLIASDWLTGTEGLSDGLALPIAGVPALAAIAAFHLLPARFRFILYWVAIVLLNAAATAAGHFLAWNPYVGVGLPLSLVVPALVLAAIALLGRRSLRRRPRPG
jgi:uncharacterized membrane-anchored protein